jgi:hypothetical protein
MIRYPHTHSALLQSEDKFSSVANTNNSHTIEDVRRLSRMQKFRRNNRYRANVIGSKRYHQSCCACLLRFMKTLPNAPDFGFHRFIITSEVGSSLKPRISSKLIVKNICGHFKYWWHSASVLSLRVIDNWNGTENCLYYESCRFRSSEIC